MVWWEKLVVWENDGLEKRWFGQKEGLVKERVWKIKGLENEALQNVLGFLSR